MRTPKSLFLFLLFLFTSLFAVAQKPLSFRDTTIKTPQTFAMIIGVSKYKYIRPLQFADRDAELFRDHLKSPAGGMLRDENIFLLLNEQVDNANFWAKGFQWLRAKKLQKGDRLYIYLAGHGDAIDEDQFFFLGYDCNPAGDKNNYLVGGAIQLFNLKKKIASETSKGVEVIFIMDACRTNELPGGAAGQSFLNTAITEKKAGEIMMLATAAGHESLEDASIGEGHGLFTWYLVQGLKGLADSVGITDRRVTLQEIQTYVTAKVPVVAQQRFNKNQLPFFCCTEKNDDVISTVDSLYLLNWLRINFPKGPGNSVKNIASQKQIAKTDTALVNLYNRFNLAINEKTTAGRNNAESYYYQLEQKFPGNEYTLDAKSTLAAEWIRQAQLMAVQYLKNPSTDPVKRRNYYDASWLLEKANSLLKDDDPDFTSSLMSRFHLLRSAGSSSVNEMFENAWAIFLYEKKPAVGFERLAVLHLSTDNLDSAMFYARQAIAVAPQWNPAYNTMSKIFTRLNNPDSARQYKKRAEAANPAVVEDKTSAKPKTKFKQGFSIGTGMSMLKPTFSQRGTQNITGVSGVNSVNFDLGVTGRIPLSNTTSLRPDLLLSFNGPALEFLRRNQAGGTDVEKLKVEFIILNFSLPLAININSSANSPYFALAPGFGYIIGADPETEKILPLNKPVLSADLAFGVDFTFAKQGFVFSPQIGYSAGLNDLKKEASSEYASAISSMKAQGFTLRFYFRKN